MRRAVQEGDTVGHGKTIARIRECRAVLHRACIADSEAVKAFRARMATEAAKTHYKLRGQTAEWVNAQARNSGLYMIRVRGQAKVQAVLLLFALAHNLLRAKALRAQCAANVQNTQPSAKGNTEPTK